MHTYTVVHFSQIKSNKACTHSRIHKEGSNGSGSRACAFGNEREKKTKQIKSQRIEEEEEENLSFSFLFSHNDPPPLLMLLSDPRRRHCHRWR